MRVSEKMIQWADKIFVMEKKHKTRLVENFLLLKAKKLSYSIYPMSISTWIWS